MVYVRDVEFCFHAIMWNNLAVSYYFFSIINQLGSCKEIWVGHIRSHISQYLWKISETATQQLSLSINIINMCLFFPPFLLFCHSFWHTRSSCTLYTGEPHYFACQSSVRFNKGGWSICDQKQMCEMKQILFCWCHEGDLSTVCPNSPEKSSDQAE